MVACYFQLRGSCCHHREHHKDNICYTMHINFHDPHTGITVYLGEGTGRMVKYRNNVCNSRTTTQYVRQRNRTRNLRLYSRYTRSIRDSTRRSKSRTRTISDSPVGQSILGFKKFLTKPYRCREIPFKNVHNKQCRYCSASTTLSIARTGHCLCR